VSRYSRTTTILCADACASVSIFPYLKRRSFLQGTGEPRCQDCNAASDTVKSEDAARIMVRSNTTNQNEEEENAEYIRLCNVSFRTCPKCSRWAMEFRGPSRSGRGFGKFYTVGRLRTIFHDRVDYNRNKLNEGEHYRNSVKLSLTSFYFPTRQSKHSSYFKVRIQAISVMLCVPRGNGRTHRLARAAASLSACVAYADVC
jgi:hypothetical protein